MSFAQPRRREMRRAIVRPAISSVASCMPDLLSDIVTWSDSRMADCTLTKEEEPELGGEIHVLECRIKYVDPVIHGIGEVPVEDEKSNDAGEMNGETNTQEGKPKCGLDRTLVSTGYIRKVGNRITCAWPGLTAIAIPAA